MCPYTVLKRLFAGVTLRQEWAKSLELRVYERATGLGKSLFCRLAEEQGDNTVSGV